MLFHSTNNSAHEVNFEKAMIQGLAPDGGLYFPENFPQFDNNELHEMIGKTLSEVGFQVLKKWLKEEIDDESLQKIIKNALDFPIIINKVNGYDIVELSHGPTLAFKDIAAKCLSQLMDHFLKKNNEKAMILVATSGDTGGAVAQGFSNVSNVKVIILYPKGKVSKLQEEQLTRVSDNISSIEIDGVFDDCQSMVKSAFVDQNLKQLNLTSANSINIGRLLPQIIYFFYTYSVLNKDNLQFIIPSGNMGNLTAGLFAWKMGLPVKSFIAATNENDSVVKYYQTGIFKSQKTIATISNAMDIGNPSNFVRILEVFHHDYDQFKKMIKAVKINEQKTIQTIKSVYEKFGYLLDPHTAVAFCAAEEISDSTLTQVIISTASPRKFAYEIDKLTGIKVDDKEIIKALQTKKSRKCQMKNDYNKFRNLLLNL